MKKKTEWGFDLTDFGSDKKFKKLLKQFELKKYIKEKKVVHYNFGDEIGGKGTTGHIWSNKKPYHSVSYNYTWSNPNLKIITGNNAITGAYSSPKQRPKEKGYASYIGIVGDKERVLKLKEAIKKNARYIKDESEFRRDYI